MSKLLKWFRCGLCALFVVAVCAPASASPIAISTVGFTPNGGAGATYGPTPWDYQSVPDNNGYEAGVLTNNLGAAGNAGVGLAQGGAIIGSGPPWTIGFAEVFTARSDEGYDYGAYNDHTFTLKRIAVPVSGGHPDLMVTAKIYNVHGTLTGSGIHALDSGFPSASPVKWTSDPFSWAHDGSAVMLTIDLLADFPTLTIDNSYALAFEWTITSMATGAIGVNSFAWYRNGDATNADADITGPTRVQSGAGYRRRSTAEGYITIVASGGAASAPRAFGMALSSVPEPGTMVLMGLALLALVLMGELKGTGLNGIKLRRKS